MPRTFRNVFVWSVFLLSPCAVAQPFGVGVKLGATLTNAVTSFESASIPNSANLIVGPYAELRLPLGFSIEGDALYFPGLYSNAAGGGGSVWQFPILAKFKFLNGPVRPYVEGGPAFSHVSEVKELPDLLHNANYGITLGAGVEVKVLALRISPEIRYNGFLFTNVESPLGLFKSNRNQAVLMVGLGF
jgi:opacity protein-like surface antigen